MRQRHLYALLTVLGAALPLAFFARHFATAGPSPSAFLGALWVTDPGRAFTLDLVLSSLAFWLWSYREARAREIPRWWLYVALNLGIGLCCALPAFLWAREARLSATPAGPTGRR
tara:strand:- start:504 stop:848 length:345 start_codon:yes stop_codon:yes gene_type:complete